MFMGEEDLVTYSMAGHSQKQFGRSSCNPLGEVPVQPHEMSQGTTEIFCLSACVLFQSKKDFDRWAIRTVARSAERGAIR